MSGYGVVFCNFRIFFFLQLFFTLSTLSSDKTDMKAYYCDKGSVVLLYSFGDIVIYIFVEVWKGEF